MRAKGDRAGEVLTAQVQVTDLENAEVKAMLWDSLSNLKPLVNSVRATAKREP